MGGPFATENAWFAARDRLGDALGFLTDVTLAWQLAENRFEESRDPALLGLQARYALLTTSHRSRIERTNPRWFLKYVEAGFWPLEKALAHARQIPNPSRRAKALRLLAASPGAERGAVLDEALAAAAIIVGPRKRLNTLISLIPFLAPPARRRAERMALSATLSLYDEENENQFFNAMLRLLGLLHGPNLSLALHEIRGTDAYQYGPTGVFIRQAMANSPGTSTSTALRRIARAIELCEAWLRAVGDPPCYNVGFLVVCLAAQAPRMPRPRFRRLARVLVRRQLLWRAVKRYLRMSDGYPGKSGASIALILCLRERIFGGERMFRDHFLAVLRWMHQGPAVWQAVRRAAPLLPGAMLPELIELIITYHHIFIDVNFPDTIVSQSKLSMLEVLAPHLPQDLLVGGAVPIAESLSLGYREIALNALNVHMLMPQCLPQVTAHFRASQGINDQLRAAVTMTQLSSGLSEPGRTRAVNTAWALFLSNPSEDNVATALSVMAPRLTHPLLSEAVTFAFRLPYRTVDAIRALAPHLPAPLLADAWATAKRWKPPWDLTEHKAKVLMALIPCFSDDARTKCLSYTLRITRTIYNEYERAILLARLAFVYPRARRDALLRESVKAASSISSEFPHTIIRFLRLVGPRLPSRLLREALRMTDGWSPRKRQGIRRMVAERQEVLREMKSARARATSTIPLSCNGQISSEDDGPAVGEKITAALAAPDHERARALEALVPLLAGVHDNYAWIIWREWLRAAATGTRARLLAGLGRIMPLPLRLGGAEALAELAGAIEDVIHWMP